MSWFKVPKGGIDDLKNIPKYVFYFAVGVGLMYGLVRLWAYLAFRLDGDRSVEMNANQAVKTVQEATQGFGSFVLDFLVFVIWLIVIGAVLAIVGTIFLFRYYRAKAGKGVRYLRIIPSSDIRLDVEKVMQFTRTFGGMIRRVRRRIWFGTPWFRIRFAIEPGKQEIGIYLAYPRDKRNDVLDTIGSFYPNVEIHEITAEQFPGPKPGGAGGIFTYQLGKKKGLPLASLEQKKESPLGNILNTLRPGTYLDLQFAPVSWRLLEERSERVLDSLKEKKISEMDPEERARRLSLMRRLTGREITFKVRLSLWSNHPEANHVVRSTATAIESAMKYDGAIRFWQQTKWNPLLDSNPVPYPVPGTTMIWTGEELANLFHIPPADHPIYQEPQKGEEDSRGYLAHVSPHQQLLKEDELAEGVLIGKLNHPLQVRDVRVSFEQLSKHFIITGASGMGKSSCAVEMLQSMIDEWVKDPENSPGFTIIDPAREIIAIMENRLRTLEKQGKTIPHEKIHHFNFAHDSTHVVGLNLLVADSDEPVNEVSERISDILLHKQRQNESFVRTRRLLTMAIHSLLEDENKHTILSIEDFFHSKAFRQKVLQNCKDPYVKRFWTKIDEGELKREVEPILNRIDALLQDPMMRRMYLQKEMGLDLRKMMDEGHLVFIDVMDMNEHELKVTVGHLVNQYYQTAIRRPTNSKFHLLMIDEAHLVQIPVITQILSADRKYDFGLGLITREIQEFKDPDMVSAIKANIGMILSCAQHEGAEAVEKLSRQQISARSLALLKERNVTAYIRLKRRQRNQEVICQVENQPPVVYLPDGKPANHKTGEKDAALGWGLEWGLEIMRKSPLVRPIADVDEEIAEYMENSYEL